MKKIVSFFKRWYYRRIFFKLYYYSVFKQGQDAEYAVWGAAKAVDSISYYLTGDGKSSVSCPLKPSDSAPLKHSTMPP